MKLGYRIRRILEGESGIVERAERLHPSAEFGRDNEGNLPQIVFFRNPLGELKIGLPQKEFKAEPIVDNMFGRFTSKFWSAYKQYKPGDNYP